MNPTLFDEHPAQLALANAYTVHGNWYALSQKVMARLARSGRAFTADDLAKGMRGLKPPRTPNAIGGLFMSWSRQGLIKKIGYRPSQQGTRKGGAIAVWVGTGVTDEKLGG